MHDIKQKYDQKMLFEFRRYYTTLDLRNVLLNMWILLNI